jgi:SAM-dependent methyltransferase
VQLDDATRRRLLDRRAELDGIQEPRPDPELELSAWRGRGRIAGIVEATERAAALAGTGRVLEVGATPWLVTQLLLERGFDVVTAGKQPGIWHERELPTPGRIVLEWDGRRHELPEHRFDAERDPWPFPDGAFRLVLCADVIEHLTLNPGHLLYEAGRVLAPGGALVVSTPNAAAARKTAHHVRGRTVHWHYSGHGPTGRHNREYTASELRALLEAAAFDATVDVRNVAGYEADEPLGRILRALAGRLPVLRDRRDHLFAVARRDRAPRLAAPDWLYRSWDRDRMRAEGVWFPDTATDRSSASNRPGG